MFSYFEPNFINKLLWESVFSNFGHVIFSGNENLFFGRQFETEHFLNVLFADLMVVLGVDRYGASFAPKFLPESRPT